nr:MAG TPA: hypothetical protein [Caudoviricetes sp.]
MVLFVDKNNRLSKISETREGDKEVEVTFTSAVRNLPHVLKVDSLTMEDYIPLVNKRCRIPDKFNICDSIELSVITKENGENYSTNKITINMKGGY